MHLWKITMQDLISQEPCALTFHWETRYIPAQGIFSSFRATQCECSFGLSRIVSSKREIPWSFSFLMQYCLFRKKDIQMNNFSDNCRDNQQQACP